MAMTEWSYEKEEALFTLQLANAEKFGNVLDARMYRKKLNDLKGVKAKVEQLPNEKQFLNEEEV